MVQRLHAGPHTDSVDRDQRQLRSPATCSLRSPPRNIQHTLRRTVRHLRRPVVLDQLFAAEVRAAQLAQEAEKKDPALNRNKDSVEGDSDTETETFGKPSAIATGSASLSSSGLQPIERDPKKRPSSGGDSSGYGSTDSEWEKVEENKA